jgi:hypothetical protein
MSSWPDTTWIPDDPEVQLERAFAAGRRAGEAEGLERAAKVAESYPIYAAPEAPHNIAAAIRALKE